MVYTWDQEMMRLRNRIDELEEQNEQLRDCIFDAAIVEERSRRKALQKLEEAIPCGEGTRAVGASQVDDPARVEVPTSK